MEPIKAVEEDGLLTPAMNATSHADSCARIPARAIEGLSAAIKSLSALPLDHRDFFFLLFFFNNLNFLKIDQLLTTHRSPSTCSWDTLQTS